MLKRQENTKTVIDKDNKTPNWVVPDGHSPHRPCQLWSSRNECDRCASHSASLKQHGEVGRRGEGLTKQSVYKQLDIFGPPFTLVEFFSLGTVLHLHFSWELLVPENCWKACFGRYGLLSMGCFCMQSPQTWILQWGPCALHHWIQSSMEAILACHPAVSTEWLAGWQFPVYYDVCARPPLEGWVHKHQAIPVCTNDNSKSCYVTVMPEAEASTGVLFLAMSYSSGKIIVNNDRLKFIRRSKRKNKFTRENKFSNDNEYITARHSTTPTDNVKGTLA